MNFQIRIVKPEELDTVLDLIARIFPEADPDVTEDDVFIIAERFGKPLGFAHAFDDGDKIIFQGLGVEESLRGNGVGSALVQKMLEIFSYSDKPIFLKTNMGNPALELYEKFGFRVKRFGAIHVLERKREN